MVQEREVTAEYENLMKRNPAEPIYPAALATALIGEPQQKRRAWSETVTKLEPDWAWSHYARAQLLQEKEPAAAAAELLKMIEKELLAPHLYAMAISIQRNKLKKIDDAIATEEKMARQPDLKVTAMSSLRHLRLAKAGTSDEAKVKLSFDSNGKPVASFPGLDRNSSEFVDFLSSSIRQ